MKALVMVALTLASAASNCAMFAQTNSNKPKFEVASVKPSNPGEGAIDLQFLPGGKLRIRNVPLRIIVATAYNVPFQSPRLALAKELGKIDFERYDIEAAPDPDAVPPALSARERDEKVRLMLQSLLEERFKLKMRIEPRDQPVYVLTVAKGGPKLQKSSIEEKDCDAAAGGPGRKCHSIMGGMGRGLHGEAITIEDIALCVQNWSDRPVIDRTGLNGLYNVQTEGWAPMRPLPPRPDGGPPTGGDTGLQDPLRQTLGDIFLKLGLRMESQRAVVDMYIVEHLEKPTPAN